MNGMIRLGPEHLPLILEMQQEILAGLADQAIFAASPAELIARCLADRGICHGVMDGERLVAYHITYFPFDDPENLGRDLGLPAGELPYVAHLDTIAVAAAWRGRALARALNARALDSLRDMPFEHACSTVSPDNPSSLKVLLAAGLFVCALKEKYGGKLRFVMHRFLPGSGHSMPSMETAPVVEAPLNDIELLQQRLSSGYIGIGISMTSDNVHVLEMANIGIYYR